jgi:GT2 family glycosyltransferase
LYLFSTDTWLEPDCLEQLYRACEQKQADGAGAQILEYQDNSIQAKGSHGFDIFGNPISPPSGKTADPMFCIAGFYFIRRDTYFRLGRLDERFFIYGEEMDLSWRIWITGGLVIPVMAAKVHHRGAVGVNPAGGVKATENRTSVQKRFLANRNSLLIIAKNCQHVLLIVLLPMCGLLMIVEAIATIVMTRSTLLARDTCWRAVTGFISLRKHVLAERTRLRKLRKRSDFWMLRFLKFGFGRSHEIRAILKKGFPKFSR